VKKLRKSVNICQSYHKINVSRFLWPTVYYTGLSISRCRCKWQRYAGSDAMLATQFISPLPIGAVHYVNDAPSTTTAVQSAEIASIVRACEAGHKIRLRGIASPSTNARVLRHSTANIIAQSAIILGDCRPLISMLPFRGLSVPDRVRIVPPRTNFATRAATWRI